MSEWAGLLKQWHKEMEILSIGTKVVLGFMPYCKGVICEHKPPYGLLAPEYKIKWDKPEKVGAESGWFLSSDFEQRG